MNKLLFRLVALMAGVLFGLGMVVSDMVNPAKVTAFLDITGQWDPSLMFVMGGALMVFLPFYHLVIKRQAQPVLRAEFSFSKNNVVDSRLISGSVMFGLGWGLIGICPGPIVASLSFADRGLWVFFAAMMVGLAMGNLIIRFTNQKVWQQQTN